MPAPQAADPDVEPPLLLEVVDARGKQDVVPVFAPPRQRYLVLGRPPESGRPVRKEEPRLKGIAVRTFRDDADVAIELLLVLRGTPDTETTLSTYRLAPGEMATTSVLEDYGLASLTLRAHRVVPVTTSAPEVDNVGASLVASVGVVAGATPLYRVSLRNTANAKNVISVRLTLEFDNGAVITKTARGQRGRPLLESGATTVEGFHGRGDFVNGVFQPLPARRVRVEAVAYDDGSVEGRAGVASELAAARLVEAWQMGRVLSLLDPVERPPEPPAIDALPHLHRKLANLPWDAEQVSALVRQCGPCADVRPSTLRVIANLASDQVMQDLEQLAETGDDNERRARWNAYLAEYRAWAASRPN